MYPDQLLVLLKLGVCLSFHSCCRVQTRSSTQCWLVEDTLPVRVLSLSSVPCPYLLNITVSKMAGCSTETGASFETHAEDSVASPVQPSTEDVGSQYRYSPLPASPSSTQREHRFFPLVAIAEVHSCHFLAWFLTLPGFF